MSPQAVRDAQGAYYDAFQKLDFEAMSALWAHSVDVSCIHPGWDLVTGRAAVLTSYKLIFEGSGEMRLRIDQPHLTMGERISYIVCREVVYTEVQGTPVESVLTATNTYVLEDGVYRIAHHHAAPVLAGRPSVPPPPRGTLH